VTAPVAAFAWAAGGAALAVMLAGAVGEGVLDLLGRQTDDEDD
jgi:hypothetical protein